MPDGDQGSARSQRHTHGVSGDADRRYLKIALGLIVGFMVVEVVVALAAHSLALLSDAGHMLTDAGALGLSLMAIRLAARPATSTWTYGLKRVEVMSAAINGINLVVISALVTFEAIRRLVEPPPVAGGAVLGVALFGVAVNVLATWVLAKANRSSINVEGSFKHILTDLYGFIATVIAGAVVLATGFNRADAIASLVVVGLMLHAAWGLLRDAGRILLQAAPSGVDLSDVRRHLTENVHIREVHDLHMWTVTSNLPTLSAHLVVEDECFHDGHVPQLLDEVQECLVGHFDVEHSTFQFETASHADHEHETHP